MPLTQSQLADAVAERAGLSRAQAKGAIQAL
jgi:nucleoid DNA-binding protein